MYCNSCQYFEKTCNKVKIYASGYIYECPFYGMNEPVITVSGGNLQVMSESIVLPDSPEHVDVTPFRNPDKLTWFAKIMICYEGHGTVITTQEEITLPGTVIWVGWQSALNHIMKLDKPALKPLIPLLEERIKFNHSVVRYGSVWKPEQVKLEVSNEVPKTTIQKPKRIYIPEVTDHLLDISTPENSDKATGDQMDLFAV